MSEQRMVDQPYEKPGPPKREAYGIAAVTQALQVVSFPATRPSLLSKAGDKSIEWEQGMES